MYLSNRLSSIFAVIYYHLLEKKSWLDFSKVSTRAEIKNIVGRRIIANPHVCSMQCHQIGLYIQKHFHSKNYTVYFLMARHAVVCVLPGSSKSLCIYFFSFLSTSATWHRTPKTTKLFSLPEKSVLEMEDETNTRFHVDYIYTSWGSTFLFTDNTLYFYFIFFLLWWQLCIPKISLFLMISKEGGFLGKVKLLHVTSDVIV